jgi:RNA polymerase sigma-70 factor (ECF subfamily)
MVEAAGAGGPEIFERYREKLWRIAYGMLSSPEDAEDATQEGYLRWHRAERDRIRDPEAWLVTTVTRICIDRLRARKAERDLYVGPWLPTPIVEPGPSPEKDAEVASELSLAFLVLLERLAPEERSAFLLREVFGAGYAEIAAVLRRSQAACRQVVHRARERVRADDARFRPSEAEQAALVRAFSAALQADDYDSVLELLAPDPTYVTDGGGRVPAARNAISGADRVARCLLGVARKRRGRGGYDERLGRINGEPGLVWYRHDRPVAALAFGLVDGRIGRIYGVLNPEKLAAVPWLARPSPASRER